eukprot:scaffold81469_cov60-Phaeocystis_antarctica.AAC.2
MADVAVVRVAAGAAGVPRAVVQGRCGAARVVHVARLPVFRGQREQVAGGGLRVRAERLHHVH